MKRSWAKIKIIADTSIWIEYFKNKPETAAIIERGLLAGTIYMVGPVVAELLHGVKTEKELKKLTDRELNRAGTAVKGAPSYNLLRWGVDVRRFCSA